MLEIVPSYVQRLINEESALSEKIEALRRTLRDDTLRRTFNINEAELNLMSSQYDAMLVYRGALRARLMIAFKKIIESVEGTPG